MVMRRGDLSEAFEFFQGSILDVGDSCPVARDDF